ncbi:hypothetical protein [Thomasclavelia cocleata]|uniref:hypothetical protein n=1 Tax=Thomasclavelia cocleata TaxID=69824 RepID=UPI00256EB270|nr:hypothetical protein [Thomasclavelia cocleata]
MHNKKQCILSKKAKVSVSLTVVFGMSLSFLCINNTPEVDMKMKETIFAVNTNDLSVNIDEDEFLLESKDEKEETEAVILQEKIAMFPEYIFDDVDEKLYLLEDTTLKDIPYDDGKDIMGLGMYGEIVITGKNDFKYWRVNYNNKDYYVDSTKLTSDMSYIFTPVDEVKYSSGDIVIKELPDDASLDIAKLSLNEEIHLIGKNDLKYWKVSINGITGYIDKDYLMDTKRNILIKEDGIYTIHNESELELIWAIVRQEAGDNYEGALAVMTSAANRCLSPNWSYRGNTIYSQLTAPGQYCYSIDDNWVKFLNGNVSETIKEAVSDALNGKTNHDYTCFRSYNGGDYSRVNIGGNWYFGH